MHTLRMDPTAPAAAATPALTLAAAPAPVQDPLALLGLGSPSPLLSSGQEVDGSERGACLWRPWLSSTNDLPRQVRKSVGLATGGATGAKVTKADSEFHHPVRLFWPKSRSFDYLYSDGEILLQNFPVQATINLYEDSDSEKEEEEEEEEDKEDEADEKGPEGGVKVPGSAPQMAAAPPPFLPQTCPI
nr:protein ripply1 [Vicugna pacos]